ncbi:MAG TPA: hypothetical protein VHT24_01255 [Pseudacidobacterium sp.]|jgi:hypothetical protein|nr:hypothetical protein [Pseudacidobacterium sp.]
MNFWKTFFCATVLTSVGFAQTATLNPGTASFKIEQNDKGLGEASYVIQSTPKTYLITSNGKMTLGKFSYAFSNTQKLDTALNLISNQLSGVINGKAVSFSAKADSTGRQFQLDISANGQQQKNTVDRDQNTVLLTDLDPAAYLLLTQVALRNPSNAWVLIPKENGFLVPVKFTALDDTKAGYNGQTIMVHHTSAAVSTQNAITIELFYSNDGQLLEADLPEQNFYVIRDGFRLINRPKPPAPPHGQAPPPQQEQQQQQQPQ